MVSLYPVTDIMKMILRCAYPDLLCHPILFVISQPFVFVK